MNNLKCYQPETVSSPSGIAICLERAEATLAQALTFIQAIKPEALPAGTHARLVEEVTELAHSLGLAALEAPQPKRRA